MSEICQHCNAKHWTAERIKEHPSTVSNPLFSTCCNRGDVKIPLMQPLPSLLQELYYRNSELASHFRIHIRKYNSALAFVSLKYEADQRIMGGLQSFQIHGALYHLTGPLEYPIHMQPRFAQIFLYDPQDAIIQLQVRSNGRPLPGKIDIQLLQQLLEMLHQCNPFITIYRTVHEHMQQAIMGQTLEEVEILLNARMQLIVAEGADKRRYNIPIANEVAIIIPDEYDLAGHRDIILACRNTERYDIISTGHAAYIPLHYVLLFPHGDHGWHWALTLQWSKLLNGVPKRLSQCQYFQFRLHQRLYEPSTLFHAGRLLQQYIVDAFATIDQAKLDWLRMNQAQLHTDLYNGLADAIVRDEIDPTARGKRLILPSSFLKGDRFM